MAERQRWIGVRTDSCSSPGPKSGHWGMASSRSAYLSFSVRRTRPEPGISLPTLPDEPRWTCWLRGHVGGNLRRWCLGTRGELSPVSVRTLVLPKLLLGALATRPVWTRTGMPLGNRRPPPAPLSATLAAVIAGTLPILNTGIRGWNLQPGYSAVARRAMSEGCAARHSSAASASWPPMRRKANEISPRRTGRRWPSSLQ